MKVNTKVRYALMAIVDIATHNHKNKPVSITEISIRQKLNISYLEQLFNKLKKFDIVSSVKGPGGGYYVAKDLDKITILDIINAVGEPLKMTRCNNEGGCVTKSLKCNTHFVWKGLGETIDNYFQNITIASILENGKVDL
jgi:Rrf2 family transcriptional regulator, iron-sulfur cluster assembly transcription factor